MKHRFILSLDFRRIIKAYMNSFTYFPIKNRTGFFGTPANRYYIIPGFIRIIGNIMGT